MPSTSIVLDDPASLRRFDVMVLERRFTHAYCIAQDV
jgi:hypothetical protein